LNEYLKLNLAEIARLVLFSTINKNVMFKMTKCRLLTKVSNMKGMAGELNKLNKIAKNEIRNSNCLKFCKFIESINYKGIHIIR